MRRKLNNWIPRGLGLLLAIPAFAQNPRIVYDRPATVTLQQLSHHVPARASKEFAAGMKASANHKQEDAILHLKKAISFDPEYLTALNNLGVIYLRSDQNDLAIGEFQRAIAVDPGAADVYLNLAIAYLVQHEYKDSERVVRQVLHLDPTCERAMVMLGISLTIQNKFTDEAESNLRRAAQDFPVARVWLGVGLVAKGNLGAAREQVTAYLQSGDKDEETVQKASDLLRRIERAAQTKQAGLQAGSAVNAGPGSNY